MSIRIKIPGVGEAEAVNAAQEDTLRQLVSLTAQAAGRNRRFDSDMASKLNAQQDAAEDAAQSMAKLSAYSRQAGSSSSTYFNSLNSYISETSFNARSMTDSLANFGRDLATMPFQITNSLFRAFNSSNLADPVVEAAKTLNLGIGLAASSVTALAAVLGGVPKLFGLDAVGSAIQTAGGKSAEILQNVFTNLNDRMAAELVQSIASLQEFNKVGASFSGGITELRMAASYGGLLLDQYTRVVKNSRENMLMFGSNMRDASITLSSYSNYMAKFTTDGTADGRTFRNELRMMGYGVEEQTELIASYLAMQRQNMTAERFAQLTRKEVAEGTRQYAADLKILAEFTGKDAKALMERARQESMRGALLSELNAEQRKSFMDTSSALSRFPDSIRGNIERALVQQLKGGAITEPLIAANVEASEFVRDLAEKIRRGETSMIDYTIQQAEILRQQNDRYVKLNKGVEDTAAVFGATGFVAELANFRNAVSGMKILDPNAVERSREALEKQAKAGDPVSKAFLVAADSAQNFGIFVQDLATKYMPQYSKLIADTAEISARVIATLTAALAGDPRAISSIKEQLEKLSNKIEGMTENIGTRAKGGKILKPELSYIGEAGPEAVVPLVDGKTIPVNLTGIEKLMTPEINFDTKQLTQAFAEVIRAKSMPQQTTTKPDDYKQEMSTALSTAVSDILTGPSGFISALNTVKVQLADDNDKQLHIMREQISKLDELVRAMQDNIRVNENIANVLS